MPIIDFIVSHYVLMILLLLATIINFVWLFLNRKDLKMNLLVLILFSIFHTIIGVLFVALFAFAESGFNLDSFGNLSLYGGVFLMPIVYLGYALIRNVPIGRAFDIFTISLIETLFFARINCIVSGCCYGILIGETGFRFPTRELELFFYLVFIIVFVDKILKNKTNGNIYPVYMISYGIFRFITEFLRSDNNNGFWHLGHIWSLISIFVGAVFLIFIFMRGRKNETV